MSSASPLFCEHFYVTKAEELFSSAAFSHSVEPKGQEMLFSCFSLSRRLFRSTFYFNCLRLSCGSKGKKLKNEFEYEKLKFDLMEHFFDRAFSILRGRWQSCSASFFFLMINDPCEQHERFNALPMFHIAHTAFWVILLLEEGSFATRTTRAPPPSLSFRTLRRL